ncbi:kinase-like domain-containing protein, partial [Mycena leptocephala]
VKSLIFKALLRLSRASGLHPQCFPLSGVQKEGQQVTGGGLEIFGKAWATDKRSALNREALIWRQLCHSNVLPFFGIYYLENRTRLCLVAPWMENGNIMKFLTNNNPSNTDRLSLILDVAQGLQYLHEEEVTHGDLKGV